VECDFLAVFGRCEQSGYNLAIIRPTIQLIIAIKQGLKVFRCNNGLVCAAWSKVLLKAAELLLPDDVGKMGVESKMGRTWKVGQDEVGGSGWWSVLVEIYEEQVPYTDHSHMLNSCIGICAGGQDGIAATGDITHVLTPDTCNKTQARNGSCDSRHTTASQCRFTKIIN
jgi:hypothetical protein